MKLTWKKKSDFRHGLNLQHVGDIYRPTRERQSGLNHVRKVPVGIRTLAIRLRVVELFEHLAKGSTHRKQVEKLGFYTFLSVVSGES